MLNFCRSSIGRKIIMAGTGFALVGFVIAHMIGNLQVFKGPEAINHYAEFLQSLGGVLWIARIGLIVAVVLHVITAISLNRENKAARKVAYDNRLYQASTTGSRNSFPLGMVLLIFIVLHLAHYTLLWLNPEFATMVDSKGRHDVYGMIIAGFNNIPYALFYIFAMVCLGFHLDHGICSMFQTLGILGKQSYKKFRNVSRLIAIVTASGFAIIPVCVLLGCIK